MDSEDDFDDDYDDEYDSEYESENDSTDVDLHDQPTKNYYELIPRERCL